MLLALACLWLAPVPAEAFGALAHRVICHLALLHLDAQERDQVERLAQAFRGPDGRRYRDFAGGCVFADDARRAARGGSSRWSRYDDYRRWHYLNVPRSATGVDHRHCRRDCVAHAIDHHRRRFANRDRPRAERAEAMLLMAHWIADAHQPLHVAFADDAGGNRIRVRGTFYRDGNLHAVWDRGIVAAMTRDLGGRQLARALRDHVPAGQAGDIARMPTRTWLEESLALATDPRTRYCRWRGGQCLAIPGSRRLDATYQRFAAEALRGRMARAALRLAHWLRRDL